MNLFSKVIHNGKGKGSLKNDVVNCYIKYETSSWQLLALKSTTYIPWEMYDNLCLSVSSSVKWEEWCLWHTTTTKSLQSCLTLCDPMDCSLPGFSIHGILQARTLEWVAIWHRVMLMPIAVSDVFLLFLLVSILFSLTKPPFMITSLKDNIGNFSYYS